jgi:hypothetical protein
MTTVSERHDDDFKTVLNRIEYKSEDSHTTFWKNVVASYGLCGEEGYPPIVWLVYFKLRQMDCICWDSDDPVVEEKEHDKFWQLDFDKNYAQCIFTGIW